MYSIRLNLTQIYSIWLKFTQQYSSLLFLLVYRFTGGNFAAKMMHGSGQYKLWMMNEFEMMNVLHHPRYVIYLIRASHFKITDALLFWPTIVSLYFFFILSKNLWKHFCYLPWLKKFSFKINVLSIFQFNSSRLTGGLAQNPIYLSILRVPFAFLMTQRLSTCRFVFFVTSTIVQKFHYIM